MQARMETRIKNNNLASTPVKNRIIQYLYSNGIDLDIKYHNIVSDNDLDFIKDNDYILCPRFIGTRSWVIFFCDDDRYYAVNFPKHSQKKKLDLVIHPINITVHSSFYNGTIMEGIYYKMNNCRNLIIDDVYIFAGQDMRCKPKDDRLNYLSAILKKNIYVNPYFSFSVGPFYDIGKKSLSAIYEKIKSDSRIQELMFYPKINNHKIYKYTITNADLVDNIIKLGKFIMQKTSGPDVYNLLSTQTNKKISIAYIPDMATSKMCKHWFSNKSCKELLVKCQLDIEKNKWIPIEIVEADVDN